MYLVIELPTVNSESLWKINKFEMIEHYLIIQSKYRKENITHYKKNLGTDLILGQL